MLAGYDETQKSQSFIACLSGTPLEIALDHCTSYVAMRAALDVNYLKRGKQLEYRMELDNAKLRNGQTIEAFANYINDLASVLDAYKECHIGTGIDDYTKMTVLIRGLPFYIKSHVLYAEPSTFNEALEFARKAEAAFSRDDYKKKPNKSKTEQQSQNKTNERHDRNSKTYSSGSISKQKRYCTHCKRNGHTVDYCYDLKGKPKTDSMDVDKTDQVKSQDTDKIEENKKYNQINRPHMPVEISGKVVNALFDTGSGKSFISNDMLNLVQTAKLVKCSDKFISMSNDSLQVLGKAAIDIKLYGLSPSISCTQDLYVVEGMKYNVLLGIDFMKSQSIIIDTVQDAILAGSRK